MAFVVSQDNIRKVMKEGHLLLTNLETVKASKRDVEEERDIRGDMDTVQRCRLSSKLLSSHWGQHLCVPVSGSSASSETWRRPLMASSRSTT